MMKAATTNERIVFLDRDSLVARLRAPEFHHEWIEYPATPAAEVVGRLRDATIAITNKVALREPELSELPQLKLIAVAATGTDILDLDYCRERGIAVANVRGYAVHSVPEHVMMMMLALRRRLLDYRAEVERGAWQQSTQFCLINHRIRDLGGSTLGIIGYGTLGRGVADLARAFGMRVLIAEHRNAPIIRADRTPFDDVISRSDVITLHCPLNDETRGLIGRTELARMRRDAVLINCARGGVVDEEALAEALRERRIAGAGIDVLSSEPPRGGNPLLEIRLPNLIVTPHNAWASEDAMQRLADQTIDNIEAFVRGEELNRVV